MVTDSSTSRSITVEPIKKANHLGLCGAAYVTRTRDPIITNDVLYQLS
jgi:hypothetical protein